MRETDLYLPLKRFLQSQGYAVKAEVMDCDVLAVRGKEEPVVVELKLSLNLDVLLQAVARLSLTAKVYVGVPAENRMVNRRRRHVLKLLRMLGLGLVLITPEKGGGEVKVLLDPGEYQPRKSRRREERLLGEFAHRVGDPNLGGADRKRGIMTAYRQRALALAQYLGEHGPTKASHLSHELSEPKARDILYRNVYGWFERTGRGIYGLSPRGEREFPLWQRDES